MENTGGVRSHHHATAPRAIKHTPYANDRAGDNTRWDIADESKVASGPGVGSGST